MYEKELFSIVYTVDKWRRYLMGQFFQIRTDHHSLKYLLEQRVYTPSQHKLAKLLGYHYKITYKSGKENIVAYALSCQHEPEASIFGLTLLHSHWLDDLKLEWANNPTLQGLVKQLEEDTMALRRYI